MSNKRAYLRILVAAGLILSAGMANAQNTSRGGDTGTVLVNNNSNPHECNVSGTPLSQDLPACATSANGGAIVDTSGGGNNTSFKGVRSDPGNATGAVDVWGRCRYLNNSLTRSVFVPLNSSDEWITHFIAYPPFPLVSCSRPQNGLTIYPSSTNPTSITPNYTGSGTVTPITALPASVTVNEPNYYPCRPSGVSGCAPAPTWSPTATFTYTPPSPGASWTETATATFTGQNSDSGNSWTLTNITYTTATGAQCGSANGQALNSPPTSGFCNYGAFIDGDTSSASGPWSWQCTVYQGSSATASCGATKAPVCGSASSSQPSVPTTNLCSVGTASAVSPASGVGPWSWSCSNQGVTKSCSATQGNVDASCGPAATTQTSTPTSGFCSAGTYNNDLSGAGPWSWSCNGLASGARANCTASTTTPAVCTSCPSGYVGDGANACFFAISSPSCLGGKCQYGVDASNNPSSVTQTTALALCQQAGFSAVAGMSGYRHDNCDSCTYMDVTYDGSNLQSVGAVSGCNSCGPIEQVLCTNDNTVALPTYVFSGSNPLYNFDPGHYNNTTSTLSNATRICTTSGLPGAVGATGQRNDGCNGCSYVTDAGGISSGCNSCGRIIDAVCTNQSCNTGAITGQCGSASGAIASARPTSNLCNAGTISAVTGSGPWSWTCLGTGGGSNSSTCSTATPPPPTTNIKAFAYMSTCRVDTTTSACAACVSDGSNSSSCLSSIVGSCVGNTNGVVTNIPHLDNMFCSSSTNYDFGGGNDSATDGAIATFDLSSILAGVTGSANVIIPFNGWAGIHSQSQADSVFTGYQSVMSATSQAWQGNAGYTPGNPGGEVIFIPNVNDDSQALIDISASYGSYNTTGQQGAVTVGADAYVFMNRLTGSESGKSASDMNNQAYMQIHYNSSNKTLTITSQKGSKWKAAYNIECPNAYQRSLYNGLCNGKIWGRVMVVAPPTRCASYVENGAVVGTATCWDGETYDVYQTRTDNQGGVCGNNSAWVTPVGPYTGAGYSYNSTYCPNINIGNPFF